VSNAPLYDAVGEPHLGEIIYFILIRVYTLVCTRSCLACRMHLFVIRLGRTQLGRGHRITFDSSSNQTLFTELTFDWKQQHPKFWLRIHFRLNKWYLPLRTKCD